MAKKPTPHRRAKGAGGVEKLKTPDGLRYRARRRKAGQVVLGSVRDTWDQAHADLAALPEPGEAISRIPLFQDFVERQLKGPRQLHVEHGTLVFDEIVWRTRLYGSELGQCPVDQVDADMCQRFIDQQSHAWRPVKKDGQYELKPGGRLSPASVKRIGTTISSYLETARHRPYRYLQFNPMRDVRYPARRKESQRKSLRPQEAAVLEQQLASFAERAKSQGDRFAAMVLVARDTGMRRGEICALQRAQLVKALRGWYIDVDAAMVRQEGSIVRTATKSGGARMVPIGEDTAKLLLAQPDRGPYFFTTATGKPVSPVNFTRDFRNFARSIGMPGLTPHKLRHTYISLLMLAGVDLKAIQKLVGHASAEMIMAIYAETFDEGMAGAPAKLAELLASASMKSLATEGTG
jgi:integrase